MLSTASVQGDLENVQRTELKSSKSAAINKVSTEQFRRVPLGDKSNTTDKPATHLGKISAGDTTTKSKATGTTADNMWYSSGPEDRIKELEEALRETLDENRRIHQLVARLLKENKQLEERSRELDLISMLYETAKRELDLDNKL